MWFKKKNKPVLPAIEFNSILCIPGFWQTDQELKLSLVETTNGEYIAAGGVMMHAKEKTHFKFEVFEKDPLMKQAFSVAGKVTRVTPAFIEQVSNHNLFVCISCPTGNLTDARHIAFAAQAILKAGGIGIKVETAGKAFEKDQWLKLTENFDESNLYEMFVVDSLYREDGTTFSCGMQNLGLKDTIVSGIPFQEAADLIRIFGYYQVIEKPVINPGETFTPTHDSPVYRITEEQDQPYKGEENFGNPFGMWRFTRE